MASTPTSPAETADSLLPAQSTFVGGGEMGDLVRTFRWEDTSLGPISCWPQSLRTAVQIILNSRYAMFIWWGPQLLNLYNDPYRTFLGAKHPEALGRSARQVWSEIWDQIGPRTEAVLHRGESTFDKALLLMMARHGYLEETYFTFSYSPLPADDGSIGGIFCAVTEETDGVIDKRRLGLLREVTAVMTDARTPGEVCHAAARRLQDARRDLPFSLIYLLEPDGVTLSRASHAGIDAGHRAAAPTLSLADPAAPWPLREVIETGNPQLVENLPERFTDLPRGDWNVPPDCAVLLPITRQGQKRPAGVLIAGLNPHRRFDEQFRGFVTVLSTQIAGALANATAHEEERKRAQQLAELDLAKTRFFSNVSHEFRTPLTLLLGPLEDLLDGTGSHLPEKERDELEMARRNALRLLKLVNTLLDFSRLEAGRGEAHYEPVNLGALTAEIASVFRSAMEKAGLHFTVICEDLDEPVYVDREMWEKIVLNLLSNAFKFTFTGEVALSLRAVNGAVELSVRDTGIGIPQSELGRIFERFHRVESSRARNHEGTGIGLALVQALVRLHGGSVTVQSREGHGSTFRVTIHRGAHQLPASQVEARRTPTPAALHGEAWVEEALHWLNHEQPDAGESASGFYDPAEKATGEPREAVLVVDDNADMRAYLAHLLAPAYKVHTAVDGASAIDMARCLRPALILTDIMMPGVDGFGVLRAVRNHPALRNTPVIMLSARAGEEARIEGLDAGADDYLVKPFTARELLARVSSHIRIARLRDEAAQRESRLRAEAELERRRLEEVLAQLPAAVGLLTGPDHRWKYVNDHYVRATGRRSRTDFIGLTLLESLPELQGQGFVEVLDRVYQTGKPYSGREVMARLNRGPHGEPEEAWFDFAYHPFLNIGGNVTGILVHSVDVTDRIVTRRMLEQKQAQLEKSLVAASHLAAIVESSEDGIASKSLHGIVTSWNRSAERMFGYTAQEMIGQSILKIIPPELENDEERILSTIARGERIEHFETTRLHKDGRRIDVSLTISPIRDEEGRIVGASKIVRDITERKRTEQVLRMTERLASVGKLAATVAHEINNPLEAAMNLLYLARHEDDDGHAHRFIQQAEDELGRVALLTRQTLGFYRETKGSGPLRLAGIIDSLVALFSPKARNKPVRIETQIRQDPEIHGIESEIRRLVANLLSNAIDAIAGEGTIRIRLSAAHGWRHGGQPGVRLTIADTGTGIAPENRSRLFEPFFTTKEDVGTGLGLWISKEIVDSHGGTIAVRSSVRPGSTGTVFSIFLPARSPASVTKRA